MTPRRAIAICIAVVLVVGALSAAVALDGGGTNARTERVPLARDVERRPRSGWSTSASPTSEARPPVHAATASDADLLRFDECADVLQRARAQALEQVTPYGFQYAKAMPAGAATGATRSTAPAARGDASSEATSSPDAGYSTTNVQEAGVDEPDIVKNEGRHAFSLIGGQLRSVLIDGDGTLQAGDTLALDVPDDAELLHVDGTLVVLSSGDGIATRVIVVNARDPRSLEVVRRIDVEGTYLSARQIGDTIRLVVTQNGPAFDFTYPRSDGEDERGRALAHNRAAIGDADLAEWLPDVTIDGRRRLVPAPACDDVYLTTSFAGPGSTSVITLSPADGDVLDATSVLATATEVYATTEHLYVATSAWDTTVGDVISPGVETTEIHRFDVSDPRRSVYEASGSVPGHLLQPPWFVPAGPVAQWAMSEHRGDLRVATTVLEGSSMENAVTVLRPTAGALTPIGALTGIGRGEQLYAVRFMGDRGYVVTYRKVDPLVVLDLSDARAPRALGELKVPGYSSYLHPIGDGLLLGIGQDDPDEDGLADGTQVSLFDVSDAARPRQVGRLHLGTRGSVSGVEGDPRTFTWWPRPARAVLTLANWEDPTAFHGAVAIEPTTGGLREVGRVTHVTDDGGRCAVPILRTRVIGDALLTFSASGVRSVALDDLSSRSSLDYDDARPGPCPGEPEPTTTTTRPPVVPLPAERN